MAGPEQNRKFIAKEQAGTPGQHPGSSSNIYHERNLQNQRTHLPGLPDTLLLRRHRNHTGRIFQRLQIVLRQGSAFLTTRFYPVCCPNSPARQSSNAVIAITSDLPVCWLSRLAITNHLATVFWLLSGMASRSTSSSISSSIRRRSRRGNPECFVIARRQSRRGNPDGLNKMHLLFCWIASLRSQ